MRLFQPQPVLAWLNTFAVALLLASWTMWILGGLGYSPRNPPLCIGDSTLAFGTVGAWLLRHPRKVGGSSVGWIASVPLAMANVVVLDARLHVATRPVEIADNAFRSVTSGASAWLPALLLTLVVFGLPMAYAHSLASKGLAGEENGDRIVGSVCAVLALPVLLVSGFVSARVGAAFAAAALGGALGSGAIVLAVARQRARARFVARVASGEVDGYRIETTAQGNGKVLSRVLPQDVTTYRVASFSEAICSLDHQGNAVEPLSARPHAAMRAVAVGAGLAVAAALLVTGYVRAANVEARGRVERACATVRAAQTRNAGSLLRFWTEVGYPEEAAIIASFAKHEPLPLGHACARLPTELSDFRWNFGRRWSPPAASEEARREAKTVGEAFTRAQPRCFALFDGSLFSRRWACDPPSFFGVWSDQMNGDSAWLLLDEWPSNLEHDAEQMLGSSTLDAETRWPHR